MSVIVPGPTSGGGGVNVQYKNQGVNVGTAGQYSKINFTGAGVVASQNGLDPTQLDVTVAGGGGPVIDTNTQLFVPSVYATINDALNYVKSAIRLNGALVQIVVDGTAYTETQGISITDCDLHYVSLLAVGGTPVNVDFTAIPPTPFGLPAFIFLEHSSFGPLLGNWTRTAGFGIGVLNFHGEVEIGSLTGGPCQIDGFFYNLAAFGGDTDAINATFLNSGAAGVIGQFAGDLSLYNCTITNTGAVPGISFANGMNAAVNTCTITTGTQPAIIANGVNLDVINSVVTTGAANYALDFQRCNVSVQINTLNSAVSTTQINGLESSGCISINTINNTSAGNPDFIQQVSGSMTVNLGTMAVPSTGRAVFVDQGAVVGVRIPASLNLAFTGGYNQAALIPTASGLILG